MVASMGESIEASMGESIEASMGESIEASIDGVSKRIALEGKQARIQAKVA